VVVEQIRSKYPITETAVRERRLELRIFKIEPGADAWQVEAGVECPLKKRVHLSECTRCAYSLGLVVGGADGTYLRCSAQPREP
jgi:hypothetical protein